jgi:aspartate/methionine/tyrosine aminotransferase
MTDAVVEAAQAGDKNGYGPQMGVIEARQAIVDQYSRPPEYTFTANDVY